MESWRLQILPKDIIHIVNRLVINDTCEHIVNSKITMYEHFCVYYETQDSQISYKVVLSEAKGIQRLCGYFGTHGYITANIDFLFSQFQAGKSLKHVGPAQKSFRAPKKGKYYHPGWSFIEWYIKLPTYNTYNDE